MFLLIVVSASLGRMMTEDEDWLNAVAKHSIKHAQKKKDLICIVSYKVSLGSTGPFGPMLLTQTDLQYYYPASRIVHTGCYQFQVEEWKFAFPISEFPPNARSVRACRSIGAASAPVPWLL